MLAAKRTRERAAVFVAIAAVSLVATALGAGLNGYLATAETAGVRADLDSLAGSDLALEVSLARSAAPDEQDARVREFLRAQLPESLTITRSTTSTLSVDAGGGAFVQLLSVDDLADIASLVDGSWPSSAADVAMQADAASALGLVVGSALQLADQSVVVAATWRLDDPLAGRWLGDRIVADGTDGTNATDGAVGTDVGPVVIDESLWNDLDLVARSRWALTADPLTIEPRDLEAIISGWDNLPQAIQADEAIYDVSFGQRGRLATVASENLSRIESLRAVVPVALLTIAAIALLTIVELARLLATLRSSEYRLMWARGATSRGLATTVAAETALVAIPGAALGLGLSSGVLIAVLGDPLAAARAPAWSVGTPVVVAAFIIIIASAITWNAGRLLESRDSAARSSRPGQLVGLGSLVLVVLGAALSTWQLLLYGSPITVSRDGRAQIDPVAVSAPALLLVSVVLVALAVVTALAPVVQRRSERVRGIRVALVSRLMLRRLRVTVIPLVLCALVSGQLMIAASYSATWDATFTQARELRTGSILSLSGSALTESLIDSSAAVPGVTGVAPIVVQNTPIGIEQASLVAATPDAVRALAAEGNGLVDAGAIADSISTPRVGEPLTSGDLFIQTTLTGLETPPTFVALLTDELGGLHTTALQWDDDSGRYSGSGEPGWTLIGFDIAVADDLVIDPERPPTITITGGSIDLTISWTAFALGSLNSELPRTGSGVGFAVLQGGPLRIVSGPPAETPVPVVVSRLLADRTGVEVGDALPVVLDLRQDPVTTTVAAIVPAVPGAQREFAAMVDLAVVRRAALGLYDSLPTATQAWVSTSNPNATADALRSSLPSRVSVTSLGNDQARSILGSAAVALWIGAAGAALLALLALVAVVIAQLSARRGEVVLLRALGLDAATTASTRRLELGIAIAAGLVTGIIAGAIVTVLTVPALARAAVPDAFLGIATTPTIDWIPLAIGLGAFSLSMLAIVCVYGRAVTLQARRLGAREQTQ